MNSRRGVVDHLGRWDAVAATSSFSKAPCSTSSAPPLFPKPREFSWWQVMAQCQMKRAHAGKRVMKEALAKIVIDEHHV